MAPVLLISYSGSFGGAERALIDFAVGLAGDRCLACPEGALANAAREAGIRVFPLAAQRLDLRASVADRGRAVWGLAAHGRAVRALICDLAPELVIACGMRSAIVTPAPFVFMHNDLLPGPAIGRLVRAAAARATLVVVPSLAVAADLGTGTRTAVVHPGVAVERFAANGEPPRRHTVLVLGAIVPWKRPELALDAVAIARRRCPDLRLRIVGEPLGGSGRGLLARMRMRATAADLEGAVEFAGAVSDPAAELAGATCLLHCAPREPFGLVLVEAMAAGRPVVAPAAAGPLEIVDDRSGILYPPDDAGAAAEALVKLLENPSVAASLGRHGRERVVERFDVRIARERFAAAVAPARRPAAAPAAPAAPAAQAAPAAVGVGIGALAFVTVTHNSAAELDRLLGSLAEHAPGARMVVVDNASRDATLEVARRARAGITVYVIELERNVGFGTACNRGVEAVTEPVVALVNPDVELLDDSLLRLAAEAAAGQRLLAPLVLSPDGSRQDTVHPLPTSPADLVRALVPAAIVGRRAGVALGLAPWRSTAPRRVGWAVGCALVAQTGLLAQLGPFDERIFLYGEDLDLGLRARAAGIDTWFWPGARVLHARAHSTARAFGGEPFELLARARREAIARRLGSRRAAVDDVAQAVTFASRVAYKRLLGRPTTRERRQLSALAGARRTP